MRLSPANYRSPSTYEILVRGQLGETLLSAFPALEARAGADGTILRGKHLDQAALHGVLRQIEALGLELLELRREIPEKSVIGALAEARRPAPEGSWTSRRPVGKIACTLKQSPVADHSGSRGAAGAIPRGALFELLSQAGRVTLVAAPAGSGKSVLLRSWIDEAGVRDASCFVSVSRNENSAQGFWTAVVEALRTTAPGAACVTAPAPSPSFDGWSAVERLLEEAGAFGQPVRIVIDDVHELRSPEALRQLELLLLRAPDDLHFVLAARHDPSLGLHRLRLEGELTEIRGEDLRFTIDEARELMDAAGVQISESALGLLVERTEGWAAGLRLAALSLVEAPRPRELRSRVLRK